MSKENKIYTIGIDIGGTKMDAILFDGQQVIADYRLATPKDDLDHFLIMLKALAEPLQEKAKKDKIKIKGIGVGIPGPVDYNQGKLLDLPNIPYMTNVKLCDKIKEVIDLPAKLDNDANCFLRAEMKIGAGQKYNNAYGITLGTGIGGAWWYKDKIYLGSHFSAGEPGHTIIELSSGLDLEKTYQKLTQNNPVSVAIDAYRGDELALKTFTEVGTNLGIAFANIINILDPEVIIVGGSVIESGDLFLPIVKKTMREHIFSSEAKKVKILKSKLGKHAGAIGAALLVT